MKIFYHLRKFWNCIVTIGVTESTPQTENRYIRFTNIEALFMLIGVSLYVLYSIYSGYYFLGALQGIDALFALVVIALNYNQKYKAARMIFLFTLNSIILIDACFIGNHSGIQEFFYISYTIPFLLFNVRDYKYIAAGVGFAIIAFCVYPYLYTHFTAYKIDTNTQLNIFRMNTWVIFTFFGVAVYILAYYNFKTEDMLHDSNKKLEVQALELKRSNEDLEQFAYIISHDLKAPVRNISSFMNLLGKQFTETSPKSSREFVEMSKLSADRLTRQIDDLLSYCRVDRNLPPVSSVDLNAMIKTIEIELSEKIKQKNGQIQIIGSLPVLKEMHSSLMHHVFQNLIANAIKFNSNPAPSINIGCSETNGIFTFTVQDNGIGIDPIYKSKLFQMFKRLHTSEQYEGTGIGLAVCKKIINFYKGEISFESEPGRGTTFYFTLPNLETEKQTNICIEITSPAPSVLLNAA